MNNFQIRELKSEEFQALGALMVEVYASLKDFPTPTEQPHYYEMLKNIGSFTEKPGAKVLVAVSSNEEILGGIVYFDDMQQYGSGGSATSERNASGIRLLAVSPNCRKSGVGSALTRECIALAAQSGNKQIILHTTKAMEVAWKMYLKLGFIRSEDLDFKQGELAVFGFRLQLDC